MTYFRQATFWPPIRIWLFTAICFVLPMKASFIYTLTFFLIVVWLIESGIKERLKRISNSSVCRAFLAYYLIYLLGMLWTEDIESGWGMIGRQAPFLLFIIYWSSINIEQKERYIFAFLSGLTVCSLLAHYNFLQLYFFPNWPIGIRVEKGFTDTAPFIDRLNYAPILGLGCYLALHRFFSSNGKEKIFSALMFLLLLSNLLFSAGRAGMLIFVVMCVVLVFERVKNPKKAVLCCAVLLPAIFGLAYKGSPIFAARVNQGISNLQNFDKNPDTSMGQRLVFWATSFQVFRDHPLLGIGSGDFANEYAKEKAKEPQWAVTPNTRNPHNQYVMTSTTTGLLGLFFLLAIFVKIYKEAKNESRGRAILIGYMTVCLVESYLWRSNTALTFSVLMATLLSIGPSSKNYINESP